jgi:hypothetical protein
MGAISVEDLQSEIANLRNRVDTLADRTPEKKPWYKEAATIISVAAFLFSFGTTLFSYKRANEQDIHNLKSELRGLLQRLVALPKENMEIYRKYGTDPSKVVLLAGYVNQENLLISKQASEIIKRLPNNEVSATDQYSVAMAFAASRNYSQAMTEMKNALAIASAASVLDDEVAALKTP